MASFWKACVHNPQTLWLRKAVFQVHLWIGIGLGLYVVMLSLTGSAIVYGPQLSRWLDTPSPRFDPSREVLTSGELQAAAERQYPGYTVTRVGELVSRRRPAVSVTLERGDDVRERVLSAYTGEDLGDVFPTGVRVVLWLTSLHDDLLFNQTGRTVNGVGSIFLTVLALSGVVVWWPGKKRWKRGFWVNWRAGAARFNWDLHSMLGIWLLPLTLIWCVSGIYLAFPDPFVTASELLFPPDETTFDPTTGDVALVWLVRLHFGRFRTMPWLNPVWVVLGLIPAVMFVTGAIMWWNRLFRKKQQSEEG